MAKHLVWDWNGTLLDDFSVIVTSTNFAVSTMGGEQIGATAHRKRFRRPIIDFYSELVGRELSTGEFSQLDHAFHHEYQRQLDTCQLSVDATAAIAAWQGTQSLLSMFHHTALVPLVDAHGLTDNFARVDGKPADYNDDSKHQHLVNHLAALGVAAPDCVLIGDSVDDYLSAHHAGAECVLYAQGFTAPEVLRDTGAPVADSLVEAVKLASAT